MSEPSSRGRIHFPTLVAEILSVIFAVLMALAVDEWWEGRENQQLAERMTEAVARELRDNRRKLLEEGIDGDPAVVLARVDSAVAAFRAGREPDSLGIQWGVSLLTSAAWETAQVTRATQYMELDRVVDLARVYEMQGFYDEVQDELVSLIGDLGARIESEPVAVLLALRSRLGMALGLRQTLATIYACTLVDLEGPDAPEADDCPRG